MISSSFNSKVRGVAILVNKNHSLEVIDSFIDPWGRYVLINCGIFSEKLSLHHLNAPNYDENLFSKNCKATTHRINGGGFNLCLTLLWNHYQLKAAMTTQSYMKNVNLMDIWRVIHPQTQDYSFYSCPCDSHTKTNLFLLSSQLFHRLLDSEYLPRMFSDHSPLTMSISFPDVPRKP